MFIIIDKTTNKIVQTIDKNYGIQVLENELLQEITNPILINKINSRYEYTLITDSNGYVTDITVTKTLEQYQNEQANILVVEPVDQEKVAMAEAIIDLTSEIEEIKNKLNGGN